MRPVHVVDYECVTCFGFGSDTLWESLLEKKCGLKPVTRFSTVNYINDKAACIPELDETSHGCRFPVLLDMLCRNSINLPGDAVLLTATTKDNIELCEYAVRNGNGRSDRPPTASMAETLRERLNIASPGCNINTACTSSSTAVMWAAEMISHSQIDSAIVFSADILSEFVFSGFSALKAMSPDVGRPFDCERDGLVLGEAAAYVTLMSEEQMRRQRRSSHAVIRGWGCSSDAFHITAPDRQARGLQRAIAGAARKAAVSVAQIDSICAHGTGTVYNDAMEITAFQRIFGDAIPPVYAMKGAVGHTLGPCGVLELIVAVRSLQEQTAPPVTGLQSPETAVVSCMTTAPQTVRTRYTLSVNSGFGGANTALIIGIT